MKIPFSQQVNGKNSYFDSKILSGLIASKTITVDEFREFHYNHEKRLLLPDELEVLKATPKLTTIRVDAKDRWKAGNKIHYVYNNRTKNEYQFAPVTLCKSVQKIEIKFPSANSFGFVWVDKIPMGSSRVQEIAINDGFESVYDFFTYFNTDFRGKIIHWTDLRY